VSNVNDKTIVRVSRRETFAVLDKYFIDNDDRLSWKAKGILTYLLAKPDNWRVCVADIAKRAQDGPRAVYSGLKELEQAGYVRRFVNRDAKGRITSWEIVVYERPQNEDLDQGETPPPPDRFFLHEENPDMACPDIRLQHEAQLHVANSTLLNTSINNNDFKDQQGSNNNNDAQHLHNQPQQEAPSPLEILELVEYAGRQDRELFIDRHQAIDMIQMAGSLDAAKSKLGAISAPDRSADRQHVGRL
jgi:DNA-binding transcriptional ArsR family regulator